MLLGWSQKGIKQQRGAPSTPQGHRNMSTAMTHCMCGGPCLDTPDPASPWQNKCTHRGTVNQALGLRLSQPNSSGMLVRALSQHTQHNARALRIARARHVQFPPPFKIPPREVNKPIRAR